VLSDDVTLSTPCPAPANPQADVAGAVQGLHSAGAHECADDRVNPGGIPDIVYLRRNLVNLHGPKYLWVLASSRLTGSLDFRAILLASSIHPQVTMISL